jgi:hypothetical protein
MAHPHIRLAAPTGCVWVEGVPRQPKTCWRAGRCSYLASLNVDLMAVWSLTPSPFVYIFQQDRMERGARALQPHDYSWTDYIASDGQVDCGGASSSLVSGAGCKGHYCDDVRLYCRTGGSSNNNTSSYWTSEMSEETTEPVICDDDYFVTGLSCSGHYCDNVAMQCTYSRGRTAGDCAWSGWVSEEGTGEITFTEIGYYAREMECRGAYCDDKRFFTCAVAEAPVTPPPSSAPTDVPTQTPVTTPTSPPTPVPTGSDPTYFPALPTQAPVTTPTSLPTPVPTGSDPTYFPAAPTQSPVTTPTPPPTPVPTGAPTTSSPTPAPTSHPTVYAATTEPTNTPSASPTPQKSASPTACGMAFTNEDGALCDTGSVCTESSPGRFACVTYGGPCNTCGSNEVCLFHANTSSSAGCECKPGYGRPSPGSACVRACFDTNRGKNPCDGGECVDRPGSDPVCHYTDEDQQIRRCTRLETCHEYEDSICEVDIDDRWSTSSSYSIGTCLCPIGYTENARGYSPKCIRNCQDDPTCSCQERYYYDPYVHNSCQKSCTFAEGCSEDFGEGFICTATSETENECLPQADMDKCPGGCGDRGVCVFAGEDEGYACSCEPSYGQAWPSQTCNEYCRTSDRTQCDIWCIDSKNRGGACVRYGGDCPYDGCSTAPGATGGSGLCMEFLEGGGPVCTCGNPSEPNFGC